MTRKARFPSLRRSRPVMRFAGPTTQFVDAEGFVLDHPRDFVAGPRHCPVSLSVRGVVASVGFAFAMLVGSGCSGCSGSAPTVDGDRAQRSTGAQSTAVAPSEADSIDAVAPAIPGGSDVAGGTARTTPRDAANGADGRSHSARSESALDGKLRIGLRALPDGLDPLRSLDAWGRRIADDLVFEALTRRHDGGAPWVEWQLADHCVVHDTARTTAVRCRLRAGARFHDGAVVSGQDVLYSISYWLDPRREWHRLRHGLAELARVAIVDGPFQRNPASDNRPETWIEVGFRRHEPLALELLAEIKIVPERLHRKRGAGFATAPIGSGPMRVQAFGTEELVLVRADTYAGTASVGEMVVLRAMEDGARALTLLRRGEIDVLDEVAPSHVPAELAKPGMAARFTAMLLTPPRYDLVLLNTRAGSLADSRVRAAVQTALPRYRLAAVGPASLPLQLPMPRQVPVDLTPPTRIDLDALASATDPRTANAGLPPRLVNDDPTRTVAADEMLDAIGWVREHRQRRRGGSALRLTLMWQGGAGRSQQLAAAIRHGLGELDVAVPYSTAAWSYVRLLLRRGEFELFLLQFAGHSDEDLYSLFHRDGALNFGGVRSEALDRALESYRQSTTRAERDAAKIAVADELAREHVALVLHANSRVLLHSRQLGELDFVDDLPRLDTLSRKSAE